MREECLGRGICSQSQRGVLSCCCPLGQLILGPAWASAESAHVMAATLATFSSDPRGSQTLSS